MRRLKLLCATVLIHRPWHVVAVAQISTEQTQLAGTVFHRSIVVLGSFYPRGMKPSDYLAFYAERFLTVEVDSTFYACPTARTVENWNARTPDASPHRFLIESFLRLRQKLISYN
jgi:hypothetical protein